MRAGSGSSPQWDLHFLLGSLETKYSFSDSKDMKIVNSHIRSQALHSLDFKASTCNRAQFAEMWYYLLCGPSPHSWGSGLCDFNTPGGVIRPFQSSSEHKALTDVYQGPEREHAPLTVSHTRGSQDDNLSSFPCQALLHFLALPGCLPRTQQSQRDLVKRGQAGVGLSPGS
jgi:hypothetical protein